VTLAGSHTYTGDTLVSAGTLLINGSLGATDVTVAADATIGGFGSIGGSLALPSGSGFELGLFSLTDTLTVKRLGHLRPASASANLIGWDGATPDGVYTLIDGGTSF
jgi:autotransporter-associated beta strand protein